MLGLLSKGVIASGIFEISLIACLGYLNIWHCLDSIGRAEVAQSHLKTSFDFLIYTYCLEEGKDICIIILQASPFFSSSRTLPACLHEFVTCGSCSCLAIP